jgi:uncharacterized protein DUF6958
MASDELFLTVRPESARQNLRIDQRKYEAVHAAILENLRQYGSMTFTQLGALVEEQLQPVFSGSVTWYYTTVKLDMETHGEIRRVPNSRPQLIEIVS